jgi:Fe-S cluster assembly protein SufD
MQTEILNKDSLKAHFQKWEKSLNGESKSELHQTRQQALATFEALDFPHVKHEEWKYTNVSKILKNPYAFAENTEITADILDKITLPEDDANRLVFVNGYFQKNLSYIVSPEKELTFLTLEEAKEKLPEVFSKYFGKIAKTENEAFTALNTAFASEGIFIHVPDNQVLAKPVFMYFLTDARNQDTFVQPRNLFVIGKSSQATFIDKIDTIGEKLSFNNAVTEIYLGENAQLNHYKLQNEQAQANYIGTTQVHQPNNSHYYNVTISLAGGIIRNNLNIELDGQNIESDMFGLYMLKGNTHVDNHSVADHMKPNSVSNELYKGILDEKSTGVFNGKIFVRQDAQKTNAYQQNRNVLLTDTASMNTKPQLEIWADDVKCSHGATTGILDENALFYMQARGIPISKARALLVQAFGNEIIDKVKLDALRAYLADLVFERLQA